MVSNESEQKNDEVATAQHETLVTDLAATTELYDVMSSSLLL